MANLLDDSDQLADEAAQGVIVSDLPAGAFGDGLSGHDAGHCLVADSMSQRATGSVTGRVGLG